MSRHRISRRTMSRTTTLDRDPELEVDVRYTATPGEPETGPTYACGGTPASPPEVEIDFVTIAGCSTPVTLTTDEEERLLQYLLEHLDDDFDEPPYSEDY